MRHHCMPLRIERKNKILDNARYWQGVETTRTHTFLVGRQHSAVSLENSLALLMNLNTHLLYDPVFSQEKWKHIHLKNKKANKQNCMWIPSAALFITTKNWKQPKFPSTTEWINISLYIHPMKYYSAMTDTTQALC